ncbi:1773_t:CDS:2 [Funneliformis mosseae]|uniref:1773_t:CDS:1 n=1 Tax=Funneliformis mosseae TaxID=27381 RepID=A0A9N8ZCK4_FUNMO|nr:1773_t:CDS:2 [Funneliformis mosseae]
MKLYVEYCTLILMIKAGKSSSEERNISKEYFNKLFSTSSETQFWEPSLPSTAATIPATTDDDTRYKFFDLMLCYDTYHRFG